MALPIFQTTIRELSMMETQWSSQLNPILAAPNVAPAILKKVSLVTGSNTINHLLGVALQGWRIVRLRANVSVYDGQDSNPTPTQTLILISSGPVVIDLEVF